MPAPSFRKSSDRTITAPTQSLPGNSIACNNLTTPQIAALTPAQVAACLRLQSIETVLQNQSGGSPTSGTLIRAAGA